MADDERIAELCRQAFAAADAARQADGMTMYALQKRLGKGRRTVSFAQLRTALRGRPSEFLLFNRRGKQCVVCLATAGSAAPRQLPDAQAAPAASRLFCRPCNQAIDSERNWQVHLTSSRHKVSVLLRQVRSSGSCHANQRGVHVGEPPELTGLQIGETRLVALRVENQGSDAQLLTSVHQVRVLPEVAVATVIGPAGWLLAPGELLEVQLELRPRHPGILCTLLMFEFDGFVIARELQAEVDLADDPDLPDIRAKTPYVRPKPRAPVEPPRDFCPGEKPPKPRTTWLRPPRSHKIPPRLRAAVADNQRSVLQVELSLLRARSSSDLRSHLELLHLLLHLEELQQELDVRQYDMHGALLEPSGRFLALEVPGLAEARPSVMRGDALYVSRAGESREFEGFVHAVRQEEVLLRFHKGFHRAFVRGARHNVRFAIKRTGMVFMHEAIEVALAGAALRSELLLPPTTARGLLGWPLHVPRWANERLNDEQRKAVSCVLAGTSGRLPFILWGPPGTGKTSTMVEAAVQVLRLLPDSKLLLVAPSNSAADLLAERVLAAGRPASEMLRVCAFARAREDLPPGLESVTCWDDAVSAFVLPDLARLLAKRVVVVTALMAGKLHALGVEPGHFSHLMMDEAGHAEEPLALCALAGLTGPLTAVVIAGDPKQLGPVVHSRLAVEGGLGISLLERLTGRLPYAAVTDAEDEAAAAAGRMATDGLLVKLVRNYRSHPLLLELPNTLFYGHELLPCASPEKTHTLLHWERLPNPDVPLLFHSVVGKDEQEGCSPSWFNVIEARLVLQYVQDLMAMRGRNRVSADQVGVITPYRRQVQRIRTLLNAKGLGAVQVGSVEMFQGQERRVIIMSTVRSSPSFLEHDYRHKLGFLRSPKRFNVAITRAQALLVVVGNPAVLMEDPCWLRLLQFARRHGCVAGTPLPADMPAEPSDDAAAGGGEDLGSQVDELNRLMGSLVLSTVAERVAQQAELAQHLVGVSAFAAEAGGGMVRHE